MCSERSIHALLGTWSLDLIYFFYSYEACFKGEIVLPVRSPIIPQTGGFVQSTKKTYYFPSVLRLPVDRLDARAFNFFYFLFFGFKVTKY